MCTVISKTCRIIMTVQRAGNGTPQAIFIPGRNAKILMGRCSASSGSDERVTWSFRLHKQRQLVLLSLPSRGTYWPPHVALYLQTQRIAQWVQTFPRPLVRCNYKSSTCHVLIIFIHHFPPSNRQTVREQGDEVVNVGARCSWEN